MFLMVLMACDSGGTQQFDGTKMSDYFAFDGAERANTYNNADTTNVDWQLLVEKKPQTEQKDGREIVTMEYTNVATAELVGAVRWSSTASEAVLVHGYSIGVSGAMIEFDPPVEITDGDDAMRLGDVVETDTTDSEGQSWHFTSTFEESLSTCPCTAQDDFTKCVRFVIDDGDGDPMTGPLFTGDFTLVAAWGVVYQTIPGWEQEWELTDIDYTAEGDE